VRGDPATAVRGRSRPGSQGEIPPRQSVETRSGSQEKPALVVSGDPSPAVRGDPAPAARGNPTPTVRGDPAPAVRGDPPRQSGETPGWQRVAFTCTKCAKYFVGPGTR